MLYFSGMHTQLNLEPAQYNQFVQFSTVRTAQSFLLATDQLHSSWGK